MKHLRNLQTFIVVRKKKSKVANIPATVEERLSYYIVEGTKEGLIPDLEEARKIFDTSIKHY